MIRWSHPDLDVGLAAPLSEHAVAREPIDAGVSSTMLARLHFADGATLVAKPVAPTLDWMMRETGDTGRAARLWVDGTTDRCPDVIDPALVRIEDDGAGGFVLYMRDLQLHARPTRFAAHEAARILDALAALHAAFWDERVPGHCSLGDLLTLLAPRRADRIEPRAFADIVNRGGRLSARSRRPSSPTPCSRCSTTRRRSSTGSTRRGRRSSTPTCTSGTPFSSPTGSS